MAKVIPSSREAMIQWFIERIAYWNKDPAAIGLTSPQIAALANLLQAAETDLDTARTARIDSKQATLNYHTTSDELRTFGGDLVKTIKAFAETTDDPSVYTQAAVPPPSPPTPLGPPMTPTNVTGTLNSVGAIELAWKASRAGGTSFTIERSVSGTSGPWTIIGTSEEMTFTDQAVPTGLASLNYRITAARSGGASNPTTPYTVLFGTTSSGNTASGSNDLTLAA